MPLSKLLISFVNEDSDRPGVQGRVEALRRFGIAKSEYATSRLTTNQRRLITDLQAMTPAPAAEKYHHPEADPKADARQAPRSAAHNGVRRDELTPADLAWINRLPADPEQVSYDDAVELARLAKESSSFTDRAGARLVQSVWRPIKEVHDVRAAEVALRNAHRPTGEMPASLPAALADAIAAESPDLTEDEARNRADDLVHHALDNRAAARALQASEAQAALREAETAAITRTRLAKT